MTQQFESLGKKVTEFVGHLETFPTPKNVAAVTMTSDEVTALCPVTGQPDQYTVSIEYWPAEKCIESKSLKLYFQTFRNEGIFVEALSSRIADDVMQWVNPNSVHVTITQKSRGGVSIVVEAIRQRPMYETS